MLQNLYEQDAWYKHIITKSLCHEDFHLLQREIMLNSVIIYSAEILVWFLIMQISNISSYNLCPTVLIVLYTLLSIFLFLLLWSHKYYSKSSLFFSFFLFLKQFFHNYSWNCKTLKSVFKQKPVEIRYFCLYIFQIIFKTNAQKLVKVMNLIFGVTTCHIKPQLSHRVQCSFF